MFRLGIVILLLCSCNLTNTPSSEPNNNRANRPIPKIRQGYTKQYYANSNQLKSVGHYQNGKYHGFWKFYYPNGTLRQEGHFEAGIRHGFWKFYGQNGKLLQEGHFVHGEKHGYWNR